jgi:hypothetical protein
VVVGRLDVGDGTPLAVEEAAIGLVDRAVLAWEVVTGEPLAEFRPSQVVVVDVVYRTGAFRAGVNALAVGGADVDAADAVEQAARVAGVEFVPQFVRAPDEGDVRRVLVLRKADDPRESVGGRRRRRRGERGGRSRRFPSRRRRHTPSGTSARTAP